MFWCCTSDECHFESGRVARFGLSVPVKLTVTNLLCMLGDQVASGRRGTAVGTYDALEKLESETWDSNIARRLAQALALGDMLE